MSRGKLFLVRCFISAAVGAVLALSGFAVWAWVVTGVWLVWSAWLCARRPGV